MGQRTRVPRRGGDDTPIYRAWWVAFVEWLLLTGARGRIALGLAVLFGAFFVLLESAGAVPLANTQALFYAYSGLVAGNLTLITVVVSINQLLLSRELQTPDELEPQIESVIEYRERVEEAADEIAPVKPLGFLKLLLEATREEAQRLGGLARGGVVASGEPAATGDAAERADEIEDVVETLTEQIDRTAARIVESETDTFSVLSTMLETNYAEQIHRLRTLRKEGGDDLDEPVHECIDELIDRLQEIDIARQYFKSIYLQQELSSLSRILLYAGLPAVAVAVAGLLALTVPPGEPSAVSGLSVLVPATLTVGLFPLATLASFVLRAATVTKLTAATLPFTTPEQER